MSIVPGQTKLNARDLTAEIERETNLMMAEQAEPEEMPNPGSGVGAARNNELETGGMESYEGRFSGDLKGLGGVAMREAASQEAREALNGQRDLSAQEIISSNQVVKEMVARENGYGESEQQRGANLVGADSALERKERLRDDKEDYKVETGTGWEHDILTAGQEKLTAKTVEQIDQIIKEKAYSPSELERQRFLGMNAILASYGRKFGERN